MLELDEALERFQQGALEYAGGLANHGPMAAEALVRLGHPALIGAFVDVYAPRLPPLSVGEPLAPARRAAALGRPERLPDWVATFETELRERAWPDVLRESLPDLLEGLFAGAAHGWLRVAHAVRALDQGDTPARRRELAHGLSYWAGRYQRLPGRPGARPRAGWGPERVLRACPPVPADRRRPGLFFESVRVLDAHAPFADAVASVERPAADGIEAFLSDLCRCAADLYLENPHARIAYVHVLTAPSALRLVGAHLDADTRRAAAGFALQGAAALHAVSAREAGASQASVSEEVRRLAEDPAEIRYRAACSLDEHAIKYAEACLREDALAPSPSLRLAAADAALHLQAGGERAC